ncbi:MAG: cytochrome c oxidase subunit II [Proteobacteria bacterium]|nr:cytochrome c oxidase subunit II [Pseudomonadota bacterium]
MSKRGIFIGALAALFPAVASAAYQMNLQPPVTRIAGEIYELHTLMMIIIVIVFVLVFSVMFYSIFKHRKSVGHKAAQFHESTTVEIIWTVIPFIILVGMAWPATKTVLSLKDTSNPDITIKATGYQWKWGYDYMKGEGEGISFLSALSTPQDQIRNGAPKGENYLLEVDNAVVVPVGKKVRILTTASDVIHAWAVPAFGVKQDAIPGFVRDTWFKADKEGTYRGQCSELCGKEHGFMPIVVNVVSAEKYTAWVGEQKKLMAAAADDPNKTWDVAALKARGEKVYNANCAACHQANGAGIHNAFPSLVNSKVVMGARGEQIALVLNGRKGQFMATSVMPAQNTLSDTDIAAAITYSRNAWGNKAKEDMVTPAEVKAARK